MKKNYNEIIIKTVFVIIIALLTSSIFVTIPTVASSKQQSTGTDDMSPPESFTIDELKQMLSLPPNGGDKLNPLYGNTEFLQDGIDLGDFLVNYDSDYAQTYQPWKSKAAVRCIAVTDDYQYVAVGGGYLYDNEVHIYRWNPEINQYVKVWNSGDNLIKGDVTDVDIADTDHNNFLEIVATSADGHFYVFEQKHIFDPYTNTENMFEHVYTSPYIGQAWAVELNDTDKDFDLDIIVGSWDYRIHVYEYTVHSGYPFSPEHWITYEEKWVSQNLGAHPTSIVVGDTNYNGLPDFVVGTREGSVYVFENNGTILDIHGQPFPICQDNSYKQIYFNNETIWRPIYSMAIGNLDGNKGDEVAIAAFAFNAYVLRYNSITEEYYIQKLLKGFESWTLKDDYPADEYIDWGVTSQNTYLNLQSVKLGTSVKDPVNYTTQWFYKGPYPYNSGASTTNYPCNINYTTGVYFKPNVTHSAWEIFDFGADEEGTGNGNSKADFLLSFNMSTTKYIYLDDIEVSISPDNLHWMTIPATAMSNSSLAGYRALAIDVDSVLAKNRWTYFRYVNLTVNVNPSQEYWLFGGKLNYVNMPVSTALSVTIGTLASSTKNTEQQILYGTVDGRLVAFHYDKLLDEFVLTWDSWVDDRYSLGSNIWALQQVETLGVMPDILGYTDASTNEFLMKSNIESKLPPGQSVIDIAFGDIDLDPYNTMEWLVSTSNGKVYAFSTGFSNESSITDDYLDGINTLSYYDGLNLTVAIADIDKSSNFYGPEIIVCSYDATIADRLLYDDYELDKGKKDNTPPPITIDIWGRTSSSVLTYTNRSALISLEVTGQLRQMFYESQSLPSIDGRDIDGDGDIDLVISLDNLYLLENVGDEYNPSFVLDTDYFKDVNEARGKRKYLYPQFVEFDHDSDWDLVVGYSNRLGATYFDNIGTVSNPKWVEKKSLVSNMDEEANINVFNLTLPVFVSFEDYSPWYTDQLTANSGIDYSKRYLAFYMKNFYTDEIYSFQISYNMQTSYLAAINPTLSRIEVNSFKNELVESTISYFIRNFGFRAIESWTTRMDLYNWTLTLDTADLDEDGNPEIIVGDFDNNIYAFEHMINNTYKRAFRSPDMMQFRPTNQTPYAWEQFGSYEGDFNQTIWNHVSYLVVNADVDQDGYKEIIAVAGTVIYIFEATDIDDTYTLMAKYDVLRNEEGTYVEQNGFDEPTGLTWANDLDQDGYCEILVAFKKQLFVYEYIDGDFVEVFGLVGQNDPTTGHYALPGNAKYFPDLTIAGIRTDDMDNDGYKEIILYGDAGYQGWYESGFLAVIESRIDGYELVWQADDSYMLNNKILTVEVADQDYDGYKELIVGGEKGLTIFEFNGTQQEMDFVAVNTITGHANYPIMPSKGFFGVWNGKDLLYRSHDIIQLQYGSNHSFLAVWSQYNGSYWVPYYAFSDETGSQWYTPQQIEVPRFTPSSSPNIYLPTVFEAYTGRIFIGWVQLGFVLGETAVWYFVMRYSDDYGNTWSSTHSVSAEFSSGNPFRSPVFFMNGTTNDIGFAYVFKNSTLNMAKYGQYIEADGYGTVYGEINGTEGFILNGLDVCTYPTGDRVGIAFSGVKPTENRSDYDIWYLELNRTYSAVSPARKILDAPSIEHTPSITYLQTGNHSAIVTFDSAGLYTGKSSSYAIVSENYIDWSKPDLLATYPDYVYPLKLSGHLYPQISGYPYSNYYVKGMSFVGPKVTSMYNGGYAILTKFDMSVAYEQLSGWGTEYHDDLLFQKQTASTIDLSLLDKATDIAVGDSDGDGLKEILVADGHYARLYELFETGVGVQHYVNSWTSDEFENEVSDVSIADTNTNGFPELVMSVQGEDVYVYEVTNTTKPIVNLNTIKEQFMTLNDTIAYHTSIMDDFNQDGIEDIVVFGTDGNVYAIFGNNGSVAWTTTFDSDITFISNGTINGKHAILTIQNNGKLKWYIGLTGETFVLDLQDAPVLKEAIIAYDYDNDGIEDVIGRNIALETLEVFNGKTGELLKRLEFGGNSVQALAVGHFSNKNVYIVVLSNNTLLVYDDEFSIVLWRDSSIQSTSSIFLLTYDMNNDSNDDIFVSGPTCYLYNSNGTILWNTTMSVTPNLGRLVDLNNDGILDILINNGNTQTITAIDGETGDIFWDYPTDKFYVTNIAVDISENNTLIYFTFMISAKISGIGIMSSRGEILGLYATDLTGTYNYPQNLVPTLINGEKGVIVPVRYKGVYGYSISEFDYEPVTLTMPQELEHELLTERTLDVQQDTVVYAKLGGQTEPTLFFVENNTNLVWYSVTSKRIIDYQTLEGFGNIIQAVLADPSGKGANGVFFRTDNFDFGFIDFTSEEMSITWILHENGKIAEVYDMIAAPVYQSSDLITDYMLFVFKNSNGNIYIRCVDISGSVAWSDIGLSSSFQLTNLLAGPMLSVAGELSYMFVVTSKSNMYIYYLKDGTLYASEDGSFGLAILSKMSQGDTYNHIVIRLSNQIRWYDANTRTWVKIYTLDNNNELLAMATADVIPGGDLELFASQNGTSLYAFKEDATLMWRHNHSSFITELKVFNDTYGSWHILTSDYHRLFIMDAKSGLIEKATYNRYEGIRSLSIFPTDHSTETSALFLAGNNFYGYNIPQRFNYASTSDIGTISTGRILKFTIPISLMLGTTIVAIVLFNKKPKKY